LARRTPIEPRRPGPSESPGIKCPILLFVATSSGQLFVLDARDGAPDEIVLPFGTIAVFNPGDDPEIPEAAYLRFTPTPNFGGRRLLTYTIEDAAPARALNGIVQDELDPTHTPRRASARISIRAEG
jgi:hypothetical protein